MLTRKRHDLLEYIRGHIADHGGVSPSFEEMKNASGLKSKSGVHRLITALEERGYIRRLANRARALQILDKPLLPPAKPEHKSAAMLSTETLVAELKRRGFRFSVS